MAGKLQVGAAVVCRINGIDYGFVTGIKLDTPTPRGKARGIDSPFIIDLMPTTIETGGSVEVLRLINDGGLEARNLVLSPRYFIVEKHFTLELVERQTDTILYRAKYCSVENQSWNVVAKGMVTGTFNFTGVVAYNDYSGRTNYTLP